MEGAGGSLQVADFIVCVRSSVLLRHHALAEICLHVGVRERLGHFLRHLCLPLAA